MPEPTMNSKHLAVSQVDLNLQQKYVTQLNPMYHSIITCSCYAKPLCFLKHLPLH